MPAEMIFCKRYNAKISIETCIARRKPATFAEEYDPICQQCDIGKNHINRMKQLDRIRVDLLEVAGIMARLSRDISEYLGI